MSLFRPYALVADHTCIDVQSTFDFTVPVDLKRIFVGWGPLPAVLGTQDQTGAWDAAGQTRTVQLSDGRAAQERLTAYESPHSFAYTVTPISGLLSFLVSEAWGKWWFLPTESGGTDIWWRYEFHPRKPWLVPLVSVLAMVWQGYMRRALALLVSQLDLRH